MTTYKWCWFEIDHFSSLAYVDWAAVNTRQELGAVGILLHNIYLLLWAAKFFGHNQEFKKSDHLRAGYIDCRLHTQIWSHAGKDDSDYITAVCKTKLRQGVFYLNAYFNAWVFRVLKQCDILPNSKWFVISPYNICQSKHEQIRKML